jgi:hypothetical protein
MIWLACYVTGAVVVMATMIMTNIVDEIGLSLSEVCICVVFGLLWPVVLPGFLVLSLVRR